MNQSLKLTAIALIVATCAQTASAQMQGNPDGWQTSVGAGVVYGPRSLGSKKTHVLPVPNFDVRYKDWFFAAPLQGIGVQTKLDGFELSSAIAPDFNGRDPKAGPRYANLKKISMAPALRLRAAYEIGDFTTEAVVSSRLASSGKNGTTLELEEGYELYAAAKTLVTVGANARFMNGTFAKNLVSISDADAAASGLPVYRAKSGILDAGVFAQVVYPVSDHWTLFTKVSLTSLEGSARKSPLVERRTSPGILAFANYTF